MAATPVMPLPLLPFLACLTAGGIAYARRRTLVSRYSNAMRVEPRMNPDEHGRVEKGICVNLRPSAILVVMLVFERDGGGTTDEHR